MYEVFEFLLEKRGITAYKFCQDTGITQSTISGWKNRGGHVGHKTAQIICDYFSISMEYLMTGKDPEENPYYLNDETAEIAQEIFENRELKLLFDAARDSSAEDLQTVHAVLLALKKKEKNV